MRMKITSVIGIMKRWRKTTVTGKERGYLMRTVTGEDEKCSRVTGTESKNSSITTGIGKRKTRGMTVNERMVL